jgi:hypothetical protein
MRTSEDSGYGIANCIGADLCGLRCGEPDHQPIVLAEANPALAAHRTLNSLAVISGVADRLLRAGAKEPEEHEPDEVVLALRCAMARQAAAVGYSVGAMRDRLGLESTQRAARWVSTACRLARWHEFTSDQRDRLLAEIVSGAPEVGEDLRDVVLGLA